MGRACAGDHRALANVCVAGFIVQILPPPFVIPPLLAAPADIVYELLVRGALSPAYGDQFWDPLAAVMTVDEP